MMSEEIPPDEIAPEERLTAWVTWLVLGSNFAVFAYQMYVYHLRHFDAVGET